MTFSDPFEEIKKIIERNEEKIKEEKKIVNYGENEEMDGVIQRNFASFNLYSFFQYKNTTSNIILKQKLLFTEIIGQSLIYPEIKSKISTEKYDIELHPSQKKIIIFKTSYNKGFNKQLGHTNAYLSSRILIFSNLEFREKTNFEKFLFFEEFKIEKFIFEKI